MVLNHQIGVRFPVPLPALLKGDRGNCLSIVPPIAFDGSAHRPHGSWIFVARLGGRQFFREMSLLTGDPRSATVRAATDCIVLEITVDDFRRLILA